MADRVTVRTQLQGIPELERAFKELGEVLTKDVLNAALNEAVQPTVQAARTFAPRDKAPGDSVHLADSITKSRRITRTQEKALGGRPKSAFVAVGPNRNKSSHGHLIEAGHVVRSRGPHRRGSPPRSGATFVGPRPFMRPAWELTRGEYPKRLIAAVKPAIEKVLKRLNRQVRSGKLSAKARRAVKS